MGFGWAQVRGISYSTMGRPVRATVHHSDGSESRVWVDHPQRKRIENSSGQPTYIDIDNADAEYRWHDDDGVMIRAMNSPNRLVVTMGGVGPENLLRAYRYWPQPSENLLGAPSEPREVQVRGRRGWQVEFASTRKRILATTYVIDAELGVALAWRQGEEWMELSEPVLDEDFDDDLFVWDGAVRDQEEQISIQQREHEDKQRRLAMMPRSDPTWLPSKVTTTVDDGDPKTGAMDLTATLQHSQVTVRRWLTELDEPPLSWQMEYYPHTHRGQQGPWTIQIRSQHPLADGDGQRILDSITPVPPPAQSPAEIRADLERERLAAKEAAETAALGSGRQRRAYLGTHASLLIRTDFSDNSLWRETALAAMAPQPSGLDDPAEFQANLTCIDHPDNDGLTVPRLLELIGSRPPHFVFLADHETIVNPEHPIVAVDTSPEEWAEDTNDIRGQTIRIIPEQMWAIENNLSISNAGFDDFVRGTQPDGVYRGFPKPKPPAHVLTTAKLIDAVAQNTSTETLARLHRTVQELNDSSVWHVSRVTDFTQHHTNVSEHDYRGANLVGRDEYLAALVNAGSGLHLMVSIPRGYWYILFEENTLRPIAAMMVQSPAPPTTAVAAGTTSIAVVGRTSWAAARTGAPTPHVPQRPPTPHRWSSSFRVGHCPGHPEWPTTTARKPHTARRPSQFRATLRELRSPQQQQRRAPRRTQSPTTTQDRSTGRTTSLRSWRCLPAHRSTRYTPSSHTLW